MTEAPYCNFRLRLFQLFHHVHAVQDVYTTWSLCLFALIGVYHYIVRQTVGDSVSQKSRQVDSQTNRQYMQTVRAAGQCIQVWSRTLELKVNGGTPYESGIELDPALTAKGLC